MMKNPMLKVHITLYIEMTDLIEEQKRTIRKLNIKIQKVEETLKKERAQRSPDTGSKLDTVQN